MNLRPPTVLVALVVLFVAGLAATGPAAAVDDGTLLEETPERNATQPDGDGIDLLADDEETTLEDEVRDDVNGSLQTDEVDPTEAASTATSHVTSDDGEPFSNDSERDREENRSAAENDSLAPVLDGNHTGLGPLALFGARAFVPSLETGPLGGGDGASTAPEASLVDATDGSSGDESPSVDAPSAGVRGGAAPAFPTEGLALGAGTGALLLVAVTRQSILSGLSAGPALAAMAPAGALGDTADRLVRLFAPFRYSRYDDSDPLEHDRRREVFEAIEENPGTYLSAVSDATDVPLSTARHHVRVLEREDLVASAKVRGKRRFYPDGAEEVELAAAMDDGPTAAVLDALARLGPCSVATLADELGRDSSTVTHHLQRLADDDLVQRERDGRAVVNRLAPAARRMFDSERTEAGAPAAPADD